jgi:hypothetical protein
MGRHHVEVLGRRAISVDELLARQRCLGRPVRLTVADDPPTVVFRAAVDANPHPRGPMFTTDRNTLERVLAALRAGHVTPAPAIYAPTDRAPLPRRGDPTPPQPKEPPMTGSLFDDNHPG